VVTVVPVPCFGLTATQPTQSGWLAAYPDSAAVPATSSLNFTRGQTVASQVIVSLNGGIADFCNGSAGTVHVVADLDGYYAASAPDLFVPYGPARITDTRTTNSFIPANTGHSYPVAYFSDGCSPARRGPLRGRWRSRNRTAIPGAVEVKQRVSRSRPCAGRRQSA
jgi:hypothetical protein